MRRACTLLTVLVAAVCAAPAAARAPAGPAGVAFYTPPSPPAGKHGGLIWARRQSGPDALEGAARNDLLLYRSTSVGGATVAVSGSVAVPKGKAPKGGWPVITYAHGTTGSADTCAPTRGYDDAQLVSYAYPLLRRWLKAGYAIVRTDYEGLGTPGVHPFLVGTSEGRGVLDAVRAARADVPALSKQVVIAGHSQGGHAALFAAALAPKWVPELKVRGTVALAPPAHLVDQAKIVSSLNGPGGGLSAFVAMILRGLDETTSLDVPGLLTPKASPLYPQTLSDCYSVLRQPASWGGLAPSEILRTDVDQAPFLAAVAAGDPQSLRIRTPLRIDQGASDTTVFKVFTDRLVADYKAAKVKLTYKVYAGVDHSGVMKAAAKNATRWIKARFGR